MAAAGEEDVPQELVESFHSFRTALDNIEKVLKPFMGTPRSKMLHELTPLEVAKLDLVSAYSINSLFWMYLITQGVSPRKHEIKGELERIRSYMGKVKEIEDRGKAPKLQKDAAKRFVRNAMFDLEDKNKQKKEEESKQPESSSAGAPASCLDEEADAVHESKIVERAKPHEAEKSKSDRKRQSGQKSHKHSKKSRTEHSKQRWLHKKSKD